MRIRRSRSRAAECHDMLEDPQRFSSRFAHLVTSIARKDYVRQPNGGWLGGCLRPSCHPRPPRMGGCFRLEAREQIAGHRRRTRRPELLSATEGPEQPKAVRPRRRHYGVPAVCRWSAATSYSSQARPRPIPAGVWTDRHGVAGQVSIGRRRCLCRRCEEQLVLRRRPITVRRRALRRTGTLHPAYLRTEGCRAPPRLTCWRRRLPCA